MKEYKQLITSIIIIIIVIIFDIIFEKITNNDLNDINLKLISLDEMINTIDENEEGNYDKENSEEDIEDYSKDIVKKWETYQKVLAFYIEHDEIEKIGDKLNILEKQVKIEEYR